METDQRVERFTPWGSRIVGSVGLGVVAVVAGLGIVGFGSPYHPAAYPICGLVGLLFWAVLVRPAVSVEGDLLVLRNPLTTVRVPLAAIEQVGVRQFLVVRAGARRFTSSAIGRSHRQERLDDRRGGLTGQEIASLSFAGIAERRIDNLVEDARTRQRVERYSDEQQALAAAVRREWAWPEVGLGAVLVVALVVTLAL